MSRHILRQDNEFEVVVGYDDPLDTYFAQVYDMVESDLVDEEVLVVQSGLDVQEITDPQECIDSVAAFAPAPDGLAALLAAERRNRREPTAFQRATAKQLGGVDLP
jgi:hypothetical protein